MNAIIGRLAATAASALVVALLGLLGLEVTEGTQATLIQFFTEAMTGLGMALSLIFYAIFHKLINRSVNPADDARGGG